MVKTSHHKTHFKGEVFSVKSMHVHFPGKTVRHEYTDPKNRRSVFIVPIDEKQNIYLVEMYCTAMRKRELLCPAGMIDTKESPAQVAKRECQEEAGFLPQKVTFLGVVEPSPGYNNHTSYIYLGQRLKKSKLQGDEPEELKVVKVPLSKVPQLMKKKKLMHASSILAIMMAEKYLQQHKS